MAPGEDFFLIILVSLYTYGWVFLAKVLLQFLTFQVGASWFVERSDGPGDAVCTLGTLWTEDLGPEVSPVDVGVKHHQKKDL